MKTRCSESVQASKQLHSEKAINSEDFIRKDYGSCEGNHTPVDIVLFLFLTCSW